MRARTGLILLAALFASLAGAQSPAIRSVEVRGEAQRAEVAIRGSFTVPEYAVRTTNEGRTVIVEVSGAALPEGGIEVLGSSRLVTATVASTTAHGARLELSTSTPVRHQARAARGRIYVRLEAARAGGAAEEPVTEPAGDVVLEDVHLERRDGRDRVVVGLSRATRFTVADDGGSLRFAADRVSPGSGAPFEACPNPS
ncbi:MAG: hypothetical protein AAF447_16245 [Myxococcota bacterium]